MNLSTDLTKRDSKGCYSDRRKIILNMKSEIQEIKYKNLINMWVNPN